MVRVENAVGTETEISGLRGRMEQSNEAAQAGKSHALAACQDPGMPPLIGSSYAPKCRISAREALIWAPP